MQTHLFSYRFDGRLWELEIKASSADEAKARLSQLAFARYDGTLVATIPASLSPVATVAIWIRNAAANLTRRVAALEVMGSGKRIRVFLEVVRHVLTGDGRPQLDPRDRIEDD